ncbi:MAG: UDP-glucose/GDP-mannose dehydrogenase family protein [Limnochordaceae bacterium]|nr:UDP-glucose/GDP-mannose dehydrogenase family protein [Limnochordaceae bacterium]
MRVLVVGAGRVGLTTAVALARLQHEVVCLEKDAQRVETLRQGRPPFWEAGLAEALQGELAAGRLSFAHAGEPYRIAPGTQAVILCVGTPSTPMGGIDMSQLEDAVDFLLPRLEQHLRQAAPRPAATGNIGDVEGRAVVVLATKSTVPVGTARALATRIVAQGMAGQVVVASNPEFLREGTALADALHPDRIVIGVRESEAAALLQELYRGIDAPIVVTNWQTAELLKYAANAFLATRLSLINELADLAEATNADIVQIARGIGLDPRIGPHYLRAGLGYGGSCLPKDVAGLIHVAAAQGVPPLLLTAVATVNALRPGKVVERLRQALGGCLTSKVVAVLGLSFKGGTDDLRSSPALEVIRLLVQAGARVRAYDPAYAPPNVVPPANPDTNNAGHEHDAGQRSVHEPSSGAHAGAAADLRDVFPDHALVSGQILGEAVEMLPHAYEAARGAQAVVVLTDWNEFTQLDWERMGKAMAGRVVLDARLCLDAASLSEAGFVYIAPGRGQFPEGGC